MAKTPDPVGRATWSSNLGFVAAAVGSAVGLGNIWRFPYIAGENGGGSFLLAYAVAIFLCGLPLLVFEVAAGRQYRRGILGTAKGIRPSLWFLGAGVAIIGFIILSYYLVVTGWTFGYLLSSPLGLDTSFDAFGSSWRSLVFFGLATGLSFTIVLLGVNSGIERASKALLPLLVVIISLMAGYALTLPGRSEALAFMLRPDYSQLLLSETWANAFGQAFFSLGVGMGVLVTYGSYQKRGASISKSGIAIVGADSIIALLSGLIVFPLVFSFGYSPAAGPQLVFETLPEVFQQMHLGVLVGSLFYLLLFIAAITSAVSLLEMAGTALSDGLGWPRIKSTLVTLGPLLALGSLSALSYSPVDLRLFGNPVLNILDTAAGTIGVLVGGLFTSIAIFWMGKTELLIDQVRNNGDARWATFGFLLGKYVVPPALMLTLIFTAARLF